VQNYSKLDKVILPDSTVTIVQITESRILYTSMYYLNSDWGVQN